MASVNCKFCGKTSYTGDDGYVHGWLPIRNFLGGISGYYCSKNCKNQDKPKEESQNSSENERHVQEEKQPKSPEQILAEAEAKKIENQIELEKQAARDKSDKEFLEGIKKNWKAITIVIFIVIIGFGIYSYLNGNAKQVDAKLSQELEQIEDKVKLLIESGDQEKALEFVNKLVHPSHNDMESQKFDAWKGYPKYDEYWSNKREEYKSQIMSMGKMKMDNKPEPEEPEVKKEEQPVNENANNEVPAESTSEDTDSPSN
jgi:hypothetical protein